MKEPTDYLATKKSRLICQRVPYFCERAIEALSFLIDEEGFAKATLQLAGRECLLRFRRTGVAVVLSYEMGQLPRLSITVGAVELDLKGIDSAFDQSNTIRKYKYHSQLADIVSADARSTEDYIKQLGRVWTENKDSLIDEVKQHISFLAVQLRRYLPKILSKN